MPKPPDMAAEVRQTGEIGPGGPVSVAQSEFIFSGFPVTLQYVH